MSNNKIFREEDIKQIIVEIESWNLDDLNVEEVRGNILNLLEESIL